MDSVIHHLSNWGQKCSRDNSKFDTFLHSNEFIAFGPFLLSGPLLKWFALYIVYREEKSLCHVEMHGSKIFG